MKNKNEKIKNNNISKTLYNFRYPMIVSDIFAIENPKLINLFFEKFEPLKDT